MSLRSFAAGQHPGRTNRASLPAWPRLGAGQMTTRILLLVAICSLATSAQDSRDGAAVLRAMHERYAKNWYETLTFKQESITHKPDGTDSTEIWYESLRVPGKLRIDVGQPNSPNGRLLADGQIIRFENNEIKASRPFTHLLLVLGFDVYRQPLETTIEQVKGQGIDLAKVHEDSWGGQPVYVVGADKGDLQAKQFWVEKERLLFVRLLQPDEREPGKMDDTRFEDYRQLAIGYVAARVEFYSGGKNVFSEKYSEIKVNPKLDAAIFDAKQFKPSQEGNKK